MTASGGWRFRRGLLTALAHAAPEPTFARHMKSILYTAPPSPARASLAARLEAEGYLVLAADEGSAAMAILAVSRPGAILIDLPVRGRRALLRQLARTPALAPLPRFAVTEPLRPGAESLRVSAVFVRPVAPEHLVRALAALYPQGLAATPSRPVPARRDEQIEAALALIAVEPLVPPVLAPPAALPVALA